MADKSTLFPANTRGQPSAPPQGALRANLWGTNLGWGITQWEALFNEKSKQSFTRSLEVQGNTTLRRALIIPPLEANIASHNGSWGVNPVGLSH